MSVKIDIEVLRQPELKYTMDGLAVCTIYYNKQHYTAFGNQAEDVAAVVTGDELRLVGYYKTYKWTGRNGHKQSREDFIIKGWERIN